MIEKRIQFGVLTGDSTMTRDVVKTVEIEFCHAIPGSGELAEGAATEYLLVHSIPEQNKIRINVRREYGLRDSGTTFYLSADEGRSLCHALTSMFGKPKE